MLAPLLFASAAVALPFGGYVDPTKYSVQSCRSFVFSDDGAYTCENKTVIPEDSCCFERDGVMLLTQFWDYNPDYLTVAVNGTDGEKESTDNAAKLDAFDWAQIDSSSSMPIDKSFTIHGLWTDKCDGTWNEYCNPKLYVNETTENITSLIVDDFQRPQLYKTMSKYWVNTVKSNVQDGGSITLWTHEYNKHGSCMNTIQPGCFTGEYKQHESAVEFWEKTVELWEGLNTFSFLARGGILPTTKHTYKLKDVQTALADAFGDNEVYVGCSKDGAITEIWYNYHLKGNVLTGTYKPIDALGKTKCPENVWYVPK